MKHKFILLSFFLTVSVLATAQYSSKQVDSLVNYAMKKFTVPGVAVGIVKDGKIIYNKGFGVKNVNKKRSKVGEHTQFAIASNTKAFTTAALAILVDEGKISWDTKVTDVIPEFKMYNDYVTENFIIEDLITHRSGLGLGAGDLMIFPEGTDFSINDILKNFQYFKPSSPFRTKFDYDNLLYIVAGEVIARVSKMPWEEFMKLKILEPLGLNDTYCTYSLITDKSNVAQPHAVENGVAKTIVPFEFNLKKINGAAGSFYSSVNDMSKWMILQLNEGFYGKDLNEQLFSSRQHNRMWTIHTVTGGRNNPRYNTHFSGYGYGWFLADIKGNMSVSHTGGLPGMLSKVIMIPDLKLGVVVLTNSSEDGAGLFSAVTNAIIDSYLNMNNNDWVGKYAQYFSSRQTNGDSVVKQVWETVDDNMDKPVSFNDYIGVYKDNWLGKAEVYENEGKLWFKIRRSPKLKGQMFYYNANTFAVKWDYEGMVADAFLSFCLDKDGKAQSIKLKGISPYIDFSFDFQDLNFKRIE